MFSWCMTAMERKVHVTVMVEPRQLEALDRIADEGKVSKSKIVREAIDKWLEAYANG